MPMQATRTSEIGAVSIGYQARTSIEYILFVSLSVVIGLQAIRLLIEELVFYLRDVKDVSAVAVGGIALLLFLTAFLLPPVRGALGWRNTLLLTGGGLGITKIVEQFVLSPVTDLALSMVATGLFLWLIPLSFERPKRPEEAEGGLWGVGLLTGISIDTAVKGVFGTLDLSWATGIEADLVAVILAVGQLILLLRVVGAETGDEAGPPRPVRSLSLVALGPVLAIELLLFQNIGQQTVLIGWPQPGVYAWITAANLAGVALAVAMGRWNRRIPPTVSAPVGALLVLALVDEQSGGLAAVIVLFGHLALAFYVMNITVRRSSPAGAASGNGAVAGSALGMVLFLILVFFYYASFDIDLAIPRWVVPPLAAGMVALTGAVAALSRPKAPSPGPTRWAIVLPALLLVLPLVHFVGWSEPQVEKGEGLPVRVMSYNLHQGFDMQARLGMEALARVIEDESPDIVALQEISRGWLIDGSVDMLVWLSQRLGMQYVSGPTADSLWGNAVLTRLPIISAETHEMPNNEGLGIKRGFISLEMDIGGGSVLRVIATHLHAGEEEGATRIPQVRAMLDHWNGREATVLLGDLNAQPADQEMGLIREAGMLDGFRASQAPGNGYTSRPDNPYQRIDYIWISPDLKARDFSIPQSQASDHFPVAVTVYR